MLRLGSHLIVLFVLSACFSLSSAWSKTPEDDHLKNIEYRQKCERIREHNVKDRYEVDCFHNYHHFNSGAADEYYNFFRAQHYGEVRLASFNLWHPGSSKSGLKDYDLLAQVVDQWDVVAAQELLAVVGEDLRHNEDVESFMFQGPQLVQELEEEISKNPNAQERRALRLKLQKLNSNLKKAPGLLRAPGYLKLLNTLRKIDPSWALVLTPRGDAAESFHVQELTGFYYRSSRVKPIENAHCQEFPERSHNGAPYACIPNFYDEFMGKNMAEAFSRRPFMASFRSADFDFSMLSSHVIFSSPREPEKMTTIMEAAFNKPTYEDLGVGFNLQTYARFAEIKMTMDFMQKFSDRYKNSNLVYAGDMNIEASNSYWPEILKSFDGSELLIDEMTSMSQIRYRSDGEETDGLASNYDHFIFSPKNTPQCDPESAQVFNYYKEWTYEIIDRDYLVRDEGLVKPGDYVLRPGARDKISRKLKAYDEILKKRQTVHNNEIVWDSSRYQQRLDIFESRLFLDQLEDRTYYRVFFELLSDHFPISLNCQF